MNATIGVTLRLTADEVTPGLMQTIQSLGGVKTVVGQTGDVTKKTAHEFNTMNEYLGAERANARWLAIGLSFLGSSITSAGVALKGTNSALGDALGTTLLWVGAAVSAVGAAAQLVKAIGYITKAYTEMATAQLAAGGAGGLAGIGTMVPGWGWALVAGMVGVGVLTAYTRGKAGESKSQVNITNNIKLDGRVVATSVQRNLAVNWQQNNKNPLQSN